MTTISRLVAAIVAIGLASAPFAAEAKKHHKHIRHHISVTQPGISTAQSGNYPTTAGVSVPRPGTYGSSGLSIGSVTAPSVGSYYWPSVGSTTAVPTWRNTNPR